MTSKSPSRKSLKTPRMTPLKVSSAWPIGLVANASKSEDGERLSYNILRAGLLRTS